MRAPVAALLAAVLAVGAAGCTGEPPPRLDRLVIAGGSGDIYAVLGQALAGAARDRLGADARVLSTAGSLENLRLVADGKADAGFATVDAVALALQGDDPFDRALPVAALARLYDDYLQIVVAAGSGIRTVGDLAGRPVSTGAPGSGTEVVASRLLVAAGRSLGDVVPRRLSAAQAAQALSSGQIQAFFVTGGLPTPAVAGVVARTDVRLLSVPDEVTALQDQYGEYYLARSITAGTYGLESEVATVGIPNVLVVREDLPEQTAYQLTELLFAAKPELVAAHEEARRLDRRSAIATFPVPLHPGAQRYHRSSKLMA